MQRTVKFNQLAYSVDCGVETFSAAEKSTKPLLSLYQSTYVHEYRYMVPLSGYFTKAAQYKLAKYYCDHYYSHRKIVLLWETSRTTKNNKSKEPVAKVISSINGIACRVQTRAANKVFSGLCNSYSGYKPAAQWNRADLGVTNPTSSTLYTDPLKSVRRNDRLIDSEGTLAQGQ